MGRESCKGLIALLLILVSCVKDKPPAIINTVPADKRGVYIICEGQYTAGNASLYFYNPAKDSVYGDLYQGANGQPLGDVFQSMTMIGDKFFLCINNSSKVVVINTSDLKTVASIAVPYPRYLLQVDNNRAYVSSLYSSKVYIINTQSYTVTDSINLPHSNTESMCLAGTDAFICTWDTASHSIYKVETGSNSISQAIMVGGAAPQEVLTDKDQTLWVLSGNQPLGKQAILTHIEPITGTIIQSFSFPAAADPIKPVFNATKDTLYFIEVNYNGGVTYNGIYRMGIYEHSLPANPLIQAKKNEYFYALGVDPLTGLIYVGDPIDFQQRGPIYVYNRDGVQVNSFLSGKGPGHFFFYE